VISVDANVLVYAHRGEMPQHAAAVRKLRELADGTRQLALTWTALYQFLRVVTHRGLYNSPTAVDVAWRFCGDLCAFPNAVVLSETTAHAEVLDRLLVDVQPTGNLVHDAHIAAVMIEHGVRDIVTNDADFRRFPGIRVVGLD
jgi:toxin-antitoxin system PIN domain toxin